MVVMVLSLVSGLHCTALSAIRKPRVTTRHDRKRNLRIRYVAQAQEELRPLRPTEYAACVQQAGQPKGRGTAQPYLSVAAKDPGKPPFEPSRGRFYPPSLIPSSNPGTSTHFHLHTRPQLRTAPSLSFQLQRLTAYLPTLNSHGKGEHGTDYAWTFAEGLRNKRGQGHSSKLV
ncbi:hypothetical protein B0T22DRAFT_235203 [Podospora appendiculata]|uniref:Secreted protein n=1 Tax=Podospora appendiculata TaxID=314037 RepID=A0AAE0X6C4_9PEZI|nr:hypothetical protein B0T22DRAFT_235203 [Podospora appendiculata]